MFKQLSINGRFSMAILNLNNQMISDASTDIRSSDAGIYGTFYGDGPRGSNTICAEDGKVTAHMERSMHAIASQGVSGHGWCQPSKSLHPRALRGP